MFKTLNSLYYVIRLIRVLGAFLLLFGLASELARLFRRASTTLKHPYLTSSDNMIVVTLKIELLRASRDKATFLPSER
jgi:hypothetical protein